MPALRYLCRELSIEAAVHLRVRKQARVAARTTQEILRLQGHREEMQGAVRGRKSDVQVSAHEQGAGPVRFECVALGKVGGRRVACGDVGAGEDGPRRADGPKGFQTARNG